MSTRSHRFASTEGKNPPGRLLGRLWLSAVLAVALVAMLGVAVGYAQGEGVAKGYVVNGSRDEEPVAGVTVTLHVLGPDATIKESRQVRADEGGNFAFDGLDTDASLIYVATVEFAGLTYQSPALHFKGGANVITLPVMVFETTESDDEIVVERAHVIVDAVSEQKRLAFSEMYFFSNRGDKTYVGEETPSGRRATLRIPLPAQAEQVEASSNTFVEEGAVRYAVPIVPGPMRQPLVVEYSIPIEGDEVSVSRRMPYSTTFLNLLVADVGIEVEAEGFEFKGKAGQGRYFNYERAEIPAGSEVAFTLKGLTRMRGPAVSATGKGEAAGFTAVLVIGVAGALLAAVFVFYLRRRSAL